jgi:hypothetical protein
VQFLGETQKISLISIVNNTLRIGMMVGNLCGIGIYTFQGGMIQEILKRSPVHRSSMRSAVTVISIIIILLKQIISAVVISKKLRFDCAINCSKLFTDLPMQLTLTISFIVTDILVVIYSNICLTLGIRIEEMTGYLKMRQLKCGGHQLQQVLVKQKTSVINDLDAINRNFSFNLTIIWVRCFLYFLACVSVYLLDDRILFFRKLSVLMYFAVQIIFLAHIGTTLKGWVRSFNQELQGQIDHRLQETSVDLTDLARLKSLQFNECHKPGLFLFGSCPLDNSTLRSSILAAISVSAVVLQFDVRFMKAVFGFP